MEGILQSKIQMHRTREAQQAAAEGALGLQHTEYLFAEAGSPAGHHSRVRWGRLSWKEQNKPACKHTNVERFLGFQSFASQNEKVTRLNYPEIRLWQWDTFIHLKTKGMY